MASLGFSSSGSDSSYNEDVMAEQVPYLEDMWGGAGDLWDMSMMYYNPLMSGGMMGMGNSMMMMDPYWQMMMGGGAYGGVNNQENYDQAFQSLMDPTTYSMDLYADIMGGEGNDYVDAMNESIGLMYDETLDKSLSSLDQRAGLMSGSSPWEGAMGDIISDSAEAEAATKAALGYETFDQDLMNKMEIANMADANWLAATTHALDSSSGMIGGEQASQMSGLDFGGDMYNSYMQQMMLPFQMAMFYPQMMGQPVVLGEGSSSSSSTGGSIGF